MMCLYRLLHDWIYRSGVLSDHVDARISSRACYLIGYQPPQLGAIPAERHPASHGMLGFVGAQFRNTACAIIARAARSST